MIVKKILIFISMFFVVIFMNAVGENIILSQFTVLAYMSYLVLIPLSKMNNGYNSNNRFWIMFSLILVPMMILNSIDSLLALFLEMFCVTIGFCVIIPIISLIKKYKSNSIDNNNFNTSNINNNIIIKQNTNNTICKECGKILSNNSKYCLVCGAKITNDFFVDTIVDSSKFSPLYHLSMEKLIDSYIEKELVNCNLDKNTKLIPYSLLRRKKILNILFSVLLFLYISMIFFHFPLLTYLTGALILVGFFIITRKPNLIKYLRKQLKLRPNEKISNVVMSTKASLIPDNSFKSLLIALPVAVILPLIIFFNPRIFYEKIDNGYAVRFYTFGLSNFTTATIPETYNKEPVISLRGNTFSNMPFLHEVSLPDTIVEIRGQAFKNDISLKKVNIPENLEYLGGGAFYNCKSITSIVLPDTLTYMGGEVFYGAKSLEEIELSENLYEIRGSSFENCSSLKNIEIPDNILRIGGHAFDGASSLTTVKFSKNSQIEEIGPSAFRDCESLLEIELPKKVIIRPKAFKGSPTSVKIFEREDEKYN